MNSGSRSSGGKVSVKSKKNRLVNENHTLVIFVLVITFILTMSLDSIHITASSSNEEPITQNATAVPENDINRAATYELVEEIKTTMDIKKGNDFFIKISPKASGDNRLEIKSQIECDNFLSTTAKTAIDEAPDWLKTDLEDKFIELGQTRLNLGQDSKTAFGDLDGDGDLDMVCGSPEIELSYFKNCGTTYEPIYLFDESLFEEINGKLDLISAEPTLGDVDADGDIDVVVGNVDGDLYVIINDGDTNNPKFHSSEGLINFLASYSSPCLVDIDADDDLDIISGAEDGKLYFYRNIGTPEEYNWLYTRSNLENIDVGDHSKPALADLDNDGDFDLTIGEAQNNLNYYTNIGSPQSPRWLFDGTMYMGLILQPETSPELLDLNGDLRFDLVVGCNNGLFYTFENIGTASEAQWQVWSSYKVFPGIEYYDPLSYLNHVNHSRVDQYAQIILDAENHLKDEIAFSIAFSSVQVLSRFGDTPKVYKENAELLYEIDEYLEYANIVDYGNFDDRDYYSTINYKYKASSGGVIQTTELPREIYYWYIVHPKITDETPAYINPATGEAAPPPLGRFWREYLFYHNDSAYPPDPPTDPDGDGVPNFHYPKDEAPPLLKEKLEGINYMYDSEPYNAPRGYDNEGHNNSRPWGYKEHALEAVSNWVCKTLGLNEQESADGERPIQPVRIAHHHNGNCGELQDLSVAAARTALIPAAGVMLFAEDHVWNEFYERGWHQWDNYWSDGGSVVDNFMNYWVTWDQRGGSGITKWHGDDYISDVTESYVPEEHLSTLTIYVRDRVGNPVDGARVMVGSHWTSAEISGYQVNIPFPSIWNYTDNNGSCTFRVATQEGKADGNKNFSFKVISKIGNAEQGKTELEHAQDYDFWFTLDGRVPESGLSASFPPSSEFPDRFSVVFNSEVIEANQVPPNPMVGNYHKQPITGETDTYFFICNQTNFEYYCQGNYRTDEPIESPLMGKVEPNVVYSFYLLDNSNWYIVWYNRHSIETNKKINLSLKLYEKPDLPPEVTILEPENNGTFQAGDEIHIKGTALDDRKVKSLQLWINNLEFDILNTLDNNTWEYTWNTTGFTNGTYNISILALDTNGYQGSTEIQIILEPPPPIDTIPPEIKIHSPSNGTTFYIGDIVELKGLAQDNVGLSALTLSISSKKIDLLPFLDGTTWSYTWDSMDQSAGEYKFNVLGVDSIGNIGRAYGVFKLIEKFKDIEPPEITINKPLFGEIFGLENQIIFEGTVEDNIGVASLEISFDSGSWQDITKSITGETWTYLWSPVGANAGPHIIIVRASDSIGNSAEASITIIVMDMKSPEVRIINPKVGTVLNQGAQVELDGEVKDNIGIEQVIITITGATETEKIKKGIDLENSRWSYRWDIPNYYPAGDYEISITVWDFAGNSNSDSTSIIVQSKEKSKSDKGWFGLPGFEGWLVIIAILCMLIFTRRHQS